MSNSTSLEYNEAVMVTGAVLSTVCVFILITALLMPPWRTLENYISVNHIVAGTLSLWIEAALPHSISVQFLHAYIDDLRVFLILELNLSSVCWSLCATIIIFMKLVSKHRSKLRHETITISAIVLGIALIAGGMKYAENYDEVWFDLHAVGVMIIMIVFEFVNVIIFSLIVFSVTSCCDTKSMKRNCNTTIILICMPIFCDVVVIAYYLVDLFGESFNWVGMTIYSLRLIPLTFVVLKKNSSREQWKRMIGQIRNRQSYDFAV